jgi:hypothetical protein
VQVHGVALEGGRESREKLRKSFILRNTLKADIVGRGDSPSQNGYYDHFLIEGSPRYARANRVRLRNVGMAETTRQNDPGA